MGGARRCAHARKGQRDNGRREAPEGCDRGGGKDCQGAGGNGQAHEGLRRSGSQNVSEDGREEGVMLNFVGGFIAAILIDRLFIPLLWPESPKKTTVGEALRPYLQKEKE